MSPEQIQRDPNIDARTDVYSIGAVLYEILCGSTTSGLDQIDKIVNATLYDEPPKPSTVSDIHVPSLLEYACMQCLQKNPDKRLASIAELLRLLQEDWQTDLVPTE
jgi:serine/threonine-protein kinase